MINKITDTTNTSEIISEDTLKVIPENTSEVISESKASVKLKKPKTAKSNLTGSLEVNTITGTVSIKNPDGSETVTEIPLKEVVISKPMINVGMSAAMTFNLGNYQSAKLSVSLHVPCGAEELEDTYGFIKDWVNGKMLEHSAEITK